MADFPAIDRFSQQTGLATDVIQDIPVASDNLTAQLTNWLQVNPDSLGVTDYLIIQTRYMMMAYDSVLNIKDTWVVSGAPDYLGRFYNGALTKPLRFVSIIWNSYVKP